jgi:hypothetical protein
MMTRSQILVSRYFLTLTTLMTPMTPRILILMNRTSPQMNRLHFRLCRRLLRLNK